MKKGIYFDIMIAIVIITGISVLLLIMNYNPNSKDLEQKLSLIEEKYFRNKRNKKQ